MSEFGGELGRKTLAETSYFPRSSSAELHHLRELVISQDVEIMPIGKVGYVVHNNKMSLNAEAPWILMDFDDTGAQTTKDKAKCWQKLESLGFEKEIIQYCDNRSRVTYTNGERVYQPELEMRLLSAMEVFRKDGKISFSSETQSMVEEIRGELLERKNLHEFQISPEIQKIYDETRFSATLYPDTINTLKKLKSIDPQSPRPANVAIFTYGDPAYQLARTRQLLEVGVVNDIFLTKVPKGEYFEELINENPFKKLPLKYNYPETQRGIGIQFKEWNIVVELFDDDPDQVENFNNIAKKLDLRALGAVRVRRQGTKRAEKEAGKRGSAGEIHLENSYLDTDLYLAVHKELQNCVIEEEIIRGIQTGGEYPLWQIRPILEVIAKRRGISFEEEMVNFSKKTVDRRKNI